MATPIEEFFIGLGFTVARSQLHTFNNAISSSRSAFAALATAAEDMAAAVSAAFVKISDDMDKLYFQSMRTKASAESLVEFGYAARQTGVSAETAASSIENLASKLRRMPGLGAMLQNMGINETDPVKMVEALQKRMANLPMYNQLMYADMFGIDEKLYLALHNQKGFREEQEATAKTLGVDMDKAAKAANTLWTQLRSIGNVFDTIIARVVQDVSGKMGASINKMRNLLLENGEAIAKTIGTIVNFITSTIVFFTKLTVIAVHAFQMILDWFNGLSTLTSRIIEGVAALIAIISVLRGGLLAVALLNPFSLMLAGLAALLLLFDDYEHYKKYGKAHSLFDWGGMDEMIKNLTIGLTAAADAVKAAWQWFLDMIDGKTQSGESLDDWGRRQIEIAQRALGLSSREDAPNARPGSNNQLTANRAAAIGGVLSAEGTGLTRANVAGILGNLESEDGSFDPRTTSDGGKHVGIAQWDATRQAKFRELYGINIQDATVEQQAQFIVWELHHTHKKVLEDLGRTSDSYTNSAQVVQDGYEVPFTPGSAAAAAELHDHRGPRAGYYYNRPMVTGHRLFEHGPIPPTNETPTGPIDESHPEEPRPDLIPRMHPTSYTTRGGDTNIEQHNHFNIQATDPHGTATEIEQLQAHTAQILARNTRRTMV